MKCVLLETPYAGDVERNVAYARVAMLDSLRRGESPFLSHLLYTQVLDDALPEERSLGIAAGLEWGRNADASIFYVDFGVSKGMELGMRAAVKANRIIIERKLMKENAFTPADHEKPLVRRMITYLDHLRDGGSWLYEDFLKLTGAA